MLKEENLINIKKYIESGALRSSMTRNGLTVEEMNFIENSINYSLFQSAINLINYEDK